jgi:TolA-binding protein
MTRFLPLILLGLAAWSGCASRGEIVGFQEDLAHIRGKVDRVEARQTEQDSLLIGRVEFLKDRFRETEAVLRLLKAEQLQGTDELRNLIGEVRSTLEDAQTYNRRLAQKVDELNLILARQGLRQQRDSLAQADPSWLYNQATLDRVRGLPQLARSGFREYLSRYPKGEMVPLCHYWIADTWLSEQQPDSALGQYETFERLAPDHFQVPASMVRRAMILAGNGKSEQARQLLETVRRRWPTRPEAELARERLEELGF